MPTLPPRHKARRESTIQDEIRLALGKEPDLVLWRNNQHFGQEVDEHGGTRSFYAGLGKGSADLIGILTINYVNISIGRFIAIETKSPRGRLNENQKLWRGIVHDFNGFFAQARSVEEARAAIERARKGERE